MSGCLKTCAAAISNEGSGRGRYNKATKRQRYNMQGSRAVYVFILSDAGLCRPWPRIATDNQRLVVSLLDKYALHHSFHKQDVADNKGIAVAPYQHVRCNGACVQKKWGSPHCGATMALPFCPRLCAWYIDSHAVLFTHESRGDITRHEPRPTSERRKSI